MKLRVGGELLEKGNNVIQRQWSQSIDQIETKRWERRNVRTRVGEELRVGELISNLHTWSQLLHSFSGE